MKKHVKLSVAVLSAVVLICSVFAFSASAVSYTAVGDTEYAGRIQGTYIVNTGYENALETVVPGLRLIWTTKCGTSADCTTYVPSSEADGSVTGNLTDGFNVALSANDHANHVVDTFLYIINLSDTVETIDLTYKPSAEGEAVTVSLTKGDAPYYLGTVQSDWGVVTNTIIITNIEFEATSNVIFNPIGGGGEFKLNGEQYSESVEVEPDFSYTAKPASGWAFYGFRIENGAYKTYNVVNENLSTVTYSQTQESANKIQFAAATVVTPVFVPVDSAVFQAGANYYPFLDEASEYVNSLNSDSDVNNNLSQINLHREGQAYHSLVLYKEESIASAAEKTFNIPNGVALVIPYTQGQTTFSATATFQYANYIISDTSTVDPFSATAFLLTLRENYTMNIGENGRLIIGGSINSEMTKNPGITSKTFARLHMETGSQINMGNNSVLSSCGYITGDGSIDASTKDGVKLYQPMAILDWRGGTYTTAAYTSKESFPLVSYTIRNIQVDLSINSTSSLAVYIPIYADGSTNEACVFMIGGPNTEGLVELASGSILQFSYDDSKCAKTYIGRTTLELIKGSASFKDLTIDVGLSFDISSSYTFFTLPYTIGITVHKGTTLYLTADVALLPGSVLRIEEGGTLQADCNFVVLDGLYDTIEVGNKYPTTAQFVTAGIFPAGQLIVNGTFTANKAFGGIAQTESDKSVLNINGSTSITYKFGYSGTYLLVKTYQSGSKYTITGRVYNSAQNKLINLETGKKYYGRAGASFTGLTGYTYVPREYKGLFSGVRDGTPITVNYGTTVTFLGEWGTHKTVYQSSSAADAEIVDVHVAMGSYSSATAPALAEAEWYDDTYRYKGNGTWSQYSEANNIKTFIPSAGVIVGFTMYSDSERTEKCTITEEYRLNDYIWLNANFYLSNKLDASNLQTAVVTSGSENSAKLVVVGQQAYIVMKVYSDDLANDWTFTISYNNSGTMLTETITLSLEDYKTQLGKTHAHYQLLQAMIDYGKASNEYFNVSAVASSANKFGFFGPKNYRAKQFDAKSSYNGVQLRTTGAAVSFNNCLALVMQFKTTGAINLQNGDQIVQIGLLTGTASKYLNGSTELSIDSEKGIYAYDMAYILYGAYGSENGSDNKPGEPSGQNPSGSSGVMGTLPTVSENMIVSFDLTHEQYLSRFALRPFLVIKHTDGSYINLYGEQYLYGVESYCASINANSTNNDSKNLAYYAWVYAQIAAEAEY